SGANAAASLHTTSGDFAKYMLAIMNRTNLKSSTGDEMLSPQIRVTGRDGKLADESLNWGLGIGLQDTEDGRAFWHWGDNRNFKCYTIGYPEHKFGLVYFSNGNNGLNFGDELVKEILGGSHPALKWLDYK
ncbi:MAG: beta-lactamase family protein, partial [bacterium]|nr:beta-lactamase family protein [bacterium]